MILKTKIPNGYQESIQKGLSAVRHFSRNMSFGTGSKEERISGLKKEIEEADAVVIGADTVVAADHRILGKPADRREAREMMTLLQGSIHQVYTGVTLIVTGPGTDIRTRTFHECTDVDVYPMTDEEIEDYISTPEPYDKAGAYGIQGSFGIYIKGIRGCYYNVVGLPIARLIHELKDIMK